MSTSHPKSATGTSPASSARTPERRGATRPSQTPPARASTRSRRKTLLATAGLKPQQTDGLRAGAHLPLQGSPDELRDAALGVLQWEPLEGVTYQMNLHPDTPPWYDFSIFIRGQYIAIIPQGDWLGYGTMHCQTISRGEWMEKMQTRRFRRKPVSLSTL